jgi:predicted TPR repeat methyltransferase/thioredoxin-like negative regulator of GroEL
MDQLQTTADADALMRRAALLIDAGRSGAARPLLAAARRLAPPSAGLAQLTARLAFQDGAFEQASLDLDAALMNAPENAELRKIRAELRQRLGDVEGAARDAAEAVFLDRHDPIAKALLGALMLQLGRPEEGAACLREAVAARPADPAICEALATAQASAGDTDTALATLVAGIVAAPAAVELRNAAVLLCIRRRDFAGAETLCEAARVAGIADACTFGLRGHALSSLGRHEDAAEAYASALKLGPNDPYVRHLASASGRIPGATRAPDDYLRAVFDGYADRFESHLISLGYRIPGAIRKVLQAHPRIMAGETLGPALDLGCGTGLIALAVSDLPIGPISGVDLSTGMLAQAEAKQLYSELQEADLMTMLTETDQRWPLILAADTLCYFGPLDDVLSAVHARLEPGGWFVFSAEELLPHHDGTIPGDGNWALLRQGRYGHSRDYLAHRAEAAGFRISRLNAEIVRYEADAPVAGFLIVLERFRQDG